MIFRSIRFKIILWNVALLTLTLIICGSLAYNSLKWNLYRNLDDLLSSRAFGVIESIETYWETEKQAAQDQGVPTEAFSKINNLNFTKIARHWVETESNTPELFNIVVQIFDNQGQLLVSSTDFSKWPPIAAMPSQFFNPQHGHFENVSITINSEKRIEARAFIISVNENGRIAYTIRLLTPLSDLNTQLVQLRIILFGILPLIILFTGVVGAFLARVSLYPVDQMINAINRITARNLHAHIDVPRTHDEIQRLAETFNSMLTRIDTDFVAQQKFIQDMSHEIKTPLTILRGSMEVALKKIRSPERYEALLQDSLEQIARLTTIVETLLILARFDNHEVALQIKRFDLNSLAKRVLAEVRVLADEKKIRLDCLETSSVEIEADETQMKTLFLNLLDNAVKYTPEGGRVTITLEKTEQSALIIIQDTGIGIGPKDLPHVFERFYRAEGPGMKEKGFGLGLSLVKSIVETHGGVISVVSHLQAGTTFSIRLPLRTAGGPR